MQGDKGKTFFMSLNKIHNLKTGSVSEGLTNLLPLNLFSSWAIKINKLIVPY